MPQRKEYAGNEDEMSSKKESGRYSANVLIGNWNEERCAAEEQLRLFLKKLERGELLVVRVRRLFVNLLREVSLSFATEYVVFGSVVQLIAPDMPSEMKGRCQKGLALAGGISEKEVDSLQHFDDGCLVSCSPYAIPCVRNTFVIKSADECVRDGENLKFGQSFVLCPAQTVTDGPLYVRSETPMVNTNVGTSGHATLRLSARKDTYCRWRALYWDAAYRPETEGCPFPPQSRVVINHASSNQNLAVEAGYWFPSFFGSECQVSVHSYRDVHRRETAENLWMFQMKQPVNHLETGKACQTCEEN